LSYTLFGLQWRDPFFVPPSLDVISGVPLPGQLKRLQVPPAALPAADGQHTQGEQQQAQPGTQGPQIVRDGDEYLMLIGSGLEGVGGTALIYRSHELTKGENSTFRLPQELVRFIILKRKGGGVVIAPQNLCSYTVKISSPLI